MTASTCCRKGEGACVCSMSLPSLYPLSSASSTTPHTHPPYPLLTPPPGQQATCSCGKQSALHCTCEKAPQENAVTGPTCSCGSRPVGKCTCNNASAENKAPGGNTCPCGQRPSGMCSTPCLLETLSVYGNSYSWFPKMTAGRKWANICRTQAPVRARAGRPTSPRCNRLVFPLGG